MEENSGALLAGSDALAHLAGPMHKKYSTTFVWSHLFSTQVSYDQFFNVEVFFFFTTTVSVTDQFWLISFNDNCCFFFITTLFVVNSTVIVIIKRINKVFHFFKSLLFRARKFKQQRNFQSTRWNRQWTIFSWYTWTIHNAALPYTTPLNQIMV